MLLQIIFLQRLKPVVMLFRFLIHGAEFFRKMIFENSPFRYVEKIISQIKRKDEPVIFFAKGVHYNLDKLANIGADVLGLDWTMDLGEVRKQVGDKVLHYRAILIQLCLWK